MAYLLSLWLPDDQTKWKIVTDPPTSPKDITVGQAEMIARVFGDVLGPGSPETKTPFEIVREGSASVKTRLEAALKEAEEQATRVPGLRKQLAEIGE
jgi:hypothetical protein